MPKILLSPDEQLPFEVEDALRKLGANIAYARLRRGIKQKELARHAGVTPVTLRRVERGSPTTTIAAYFTALWALGLSSEFTSIAEPDRDLHGKILERSRAPERARTRKRKVDFDVDF